MVQKRTYSRSKKQNAYYWGVILEILSEHTGFEPEELHQILKERFLTYTKKYKGYVYKLTRSTATLNITEFSDYNEKIKKLAAEKFKLYIPDPGEYDYKL
jgi:hypothetical protein